jgi:hypothetical protein
MENLAILGILAFLGIFITVLGMMFSSEVKNEL